MPAEDELSFSECYVPKTHPIAVDLGLSVKWASCNVGAESPEDFGDSFAWGETLPKSDSDFKFFSFSELESRGIIDSDGNLTAAYDAATVNWGGTWRMPTSDEIRELCSRCSFRPMSVDDVFGHLVTGPNGNSIFFPYDKEKLGRFWSASGVSGGSNDNACSLSIIGTDHKLFWSADRDDRLPVRPVSDK